ncbi:EAL domain-containing protein [Jatrophihabitans endophyticus]|uniref:EAL domain-containing protein n=1 Tax=Jatrophihabitans endophyticus TaxID=1206085 RepID=UPI00190ECBD6|nr:EAL domain-containing protein [Jatrophihabitans endophyticus]
MTDLIARGDVRTVFQPIVDLDEGTVVAYEALSRGPAGPWERPDALFAAARTQGALAELDVLCRREALRSAVAVGIAEPLAVFVNVEPEVLDSEPLGALIEIADAAPEGLRVVLEITERAIAARPAELLACVRTLRRAGWQIALDDVGADDMSLAFMPLLRPDVVKLDIQLVQDRPSPAIAGIMNAVNAYAQRTGAVVLAEGIEDEKHLDIARALGARLGQGFLFGRPAAEPSNALPRGVLELAERDLPRDIDSPFACLPEDVVLRRSSKPLLVELSKHLEREALAHGSTCVVVSAFQYAHHFTPATARRYRELAERVGFVAAVGAGLPAEPAPGVRGADLPGDDRLRDEWDIVVMAPHFSAALLARDLGDRGPDHERRFEFALTYEREVVSAAAEALLSRVLPAPDGARPRGTDGTPPARTDVLDVAEAPTNAASVSVLRRALAATTNGVSIADVTRPDHPLVYVNAAFERLSGLRADEILGANCRVLQGVETDPAAVARIRAAIEQGVECRETLVNYRHGTGEAWWNEILLAPIFDETGRLVQYVGIQNDVTARVEAERELAEERARSEAYLAEMELLAFRDPLTGLLNRRRVAELLTEALERSRAAGTGIGLLYVDVDDFKRVNDGHGHAAGDVVLVEVADRLREGGRPDALYARVGGDEFLVVLPDLDRDAAPALTAHAASALRRRLGSGTASRDVSASVGSSSYPVDGADFDALLHAADLRMYADKARKRTA